MAIAHQGITELTTYLKERFPWKEDYVSTLTGQTFTYDQVLDAMWKLKRSDPKLFTILSYRFMSCRSRNDIATALYIDSSTLKRYWNKALWIVQNWLVHGTPSVEGEEVLLDKELLRTLNSLEL